MIWQNTLLEWYHQNGQDYPWRASKDPYRVWLSEIILQQTRVQQGLPYFDRFIENFPTVAALAAADEEWVLKCWQGLGYYSRARNLHHIAKEVVRSYGGVFPKTFEELLHLKGVGDYTASAIASICYDLPHAVVDGNVFRVLTRYFGVATPINTSQGFKEIKALATKLIRGVDPGTFNQALMDFGAHHCTPKKPLCHRCPFQKKCVAYTTQNIANLPVKQGKTKVRDRFFHFVIISGPNQTTVLEQRTEKGIWHKLYQFPLLEFPKNTLPEPKIILDKTTSFATGGDNVALHNLIPIVHKLSHQKLYIYFWTVSVESIQKNKIAIDKINSYPLPIVLENFISEFFNL